MGRFPNTDASPTTTIWTRTDRPAAAAPGATATSRTCRPRTAITYTEKDLTDSIVGTVSEMARLLKKPLIIALAAVILLVIGFFAYIQNAFTGTRCEAAKHLDADMIGDCYGCHLKVTPQVAQDWYESKHGVTLVRCQVCHGQPDGKGAVPFKRVPGVEVCAACHGLAIDKMTALYGKRDDCSTCHPYHARPMHGKVYENRQATTKTVLE